VLVFCRTKHGANRLAEQLENDGIETAAIHGNKSQPQRMKALKRFKDGELQVLVATDIAARGIDIESLPHVVNYDLPQSPRTTSTASAAPAARASRPGGFAGVGEDRTLLRDIERLIGEEDRAASDSGLRAGLGLPARAARAAAAPRAAGRRARRAAPSARAARSTIRKAAGRKAPSRARAATRNARARTASAATTAAGSSVSPRPRCRRKEPSSRSTSSSASTPHADGRGKPPAGGAFGRADASRSRRCSVTLGKKAA